MFNMTKTTRLYRNRQKGFKNKTSYGQIVMSKCDVSLGSHYSGRTVICRSAPDLDCELGTLHISTYNQLTVNKPVYLV